MRGVVRVDGRSIDNLEKGGDMNWDGLVFNARREYLSLLRLETRKSSNLSRLRRLFYL